MNRQRVAVMLALARLDRGNDYQHDIQDVQNAENKEANEHEAEHGCDRTIDQHRELKVERFFSVRIDLGGIAALGQPDDERPDNVPGPRHEKSNERRGVAEHAPRFDVR